jgi:uncharacterized membrane protein
MVDFDRRTNEEIENQESVNLLHLVFGLFCIIVGLGLFIGVHIYF